MKPYSDQKTAINFHTNILKQYLIENRSIIVFSLLLAVFSYGYELFNFTLSIDEEYDSFLSARDSYEYIRVGRWGLYYLNLLVSPHSILPYFPTLIALICIAATSVLFISGQKDGLTAKLVFSIIFITHPIHSYYLAFNTSGFYYTIGMVLTALSYLSFRSGIENNKSRFKYYFLSIILLGLALSMYQAMLAFFMVFGAYYLFNYIFRNTVVNRIGILKIIFWYMAVSVLAFVFYKVGDKAARNFMPDALGLNDSAYIDQFTLWGKWSLSQIILNVFRPTAAYLLGIGHIAGELGLSLKLTIVLAFVIVYFIMKEVPGFTRKLLSILFLIVFILSPFVVMYLNGSKLPTRTLMSLPLMIAMLWLMSYNSAGFWLKKVMIIAAFAILINNTYINTRMFYSTYVSWQADRDMANRIIERIYNLNPPLVHGSIQVVFLGMHQNKSNELFYKSDVHGASFFEWDNGNSKRMIYLFKTIGIEGISAVSPDRLTSSKNEIELMPLWPSKGSVCLMNDVVVVKLSDPVSW